MVKKTERKVNTSGKPKHSFDSNRNDGASSSRTAATVRRLKMYKTRPKRSAGGKILRNEFQSKDLPNTRIQPDRRWFGNTRVVNQKELEYFRDELQSRMSSNYNVILKEKKLPLSLLNDPKKTNRVPILATEPFKDVFGSKKTRKRPKLLAADYESLVCKVAPIPGETKVWQYISLTKRINLIDCPGVVYQSSDSETDIVLKGVVRVTNLPDASEHIGEVLKRVKKQHLQRAYKIKKWEDENDFLVQLCRTTGKLLKAGEPDLNTAAKMVLHDWQRGKIPFFVPPPKTEDDASEEPNTYGLDVEAANNPQAAAAIKAISSVISSQQQTSIRPHNSLYENSSTKGGDTSDHDIASDDEIKDDDMTEEQEASDDVDEIDEEDASDDDEIDEQEE
ncbi:hypothetical protein ACFE04_004853 [Oxalis oulophora]